MTADGQRLDKWLWFARFLKTRTAAGKYVAAGKVRANRTRIIKPGHVVCAGDILTFTLHRRLRIVEVLAPGSRRGPPEEARTLYDDLSPPPVRISGGPDAAARSQAIREQGSGRPTKKQRRELDAWLDGEQ